VKVYPHYLLQMPSIGVGIGITVAMLLELLLGRLLVSDVTFLGATLLRSFFSSA
jgi:hypothetical protein